MSVSSFCSRSGFRPIAGCQQLSSGESELWLYFPVQGGGVSCPPSNQISSSQIFPQTLVCWSFPESRSVQPSKYRDGHGTLPPSPGSEQLPLTAALPAPLRLCPPQRSPSLSALSSNASLTPPSPKAQLRNYTSPALRRLFNVLSSPITKPQLGLGQHYSLRRSQPPSLITFFSASSVLCPQRAGRFGLRPYTHSTDHLAQASGPSSPFWPHNSLCKHFCILEEELLVSFCAPAKTIPVYTATDDVWEPLFL